MTNAACLLILAGLVASAPPSIATLVNVQTPTPPQAPSQSSQLACEVTDGVPLGLSIRNEGDEDDRLFPLTFPLTLHFARAGEATVAARARRRVEVAGLPTLPPMSLGDLTIALASAQPAAATALPS